jgi:hypothetical protein
MESVLTAIALPIIPNIEAASWRYLRPNMSLALPAMGAKIPPTRVGIDKIQRKFCGAGPEGYQIIDWIVGSLANLCRY